MSILAGMFETLFNSYCSDAYVKAFFLLLQHFFLLLVPNAIRFFFSSLIANMTTILINFQQNFALVGSFQHFTIKFLNQKDFSHA